jgi:hypothetical protein
VKDKPEASLTEKMAVMSALFDLQLPQMKEAVALWQARTGETCQPDLRVLLAWLAESNAALSTLCDACRMFGASGPEFNTAMSAAERFTRRKLDFSEDPTRKMRLAFAKNGRRL